MVGVFFSLLSVPIVAAAWMASFWVCTQLWSLARINMANARRADEFAELINKARAQGEMERARRGY